MSTRQEQLEVIQDINISEGDRLTLDCPFCYGKKKFTLSYISGKLLWNCYKASCDVKGVYYKGFNTSLGLRNYLDKKDNSLNNKTRNIPSILSNIEHHKDVVKYLNKVNSYDAYKNKFIDIKYSPIDKRVVFLHPGLLGAVGRGLYNTMPKWISYGTNNYLYKIGKGHTAVLVEDVPSACSLSRLDNITGIALLGTNLTDNNLLEITSYKDVIVVLDNDASTKAIKLSKTISAYTKSTVRFTKRDLKYLSTKQIEGILYEFKA